MTANSTCIIPTAPRARHRHYRLAPWPLRFVACVLIAAELFMPCNSQVLIAAEILLAQASPAPQSPQSSEPAPVLTPEHVTVNRTVPQVSPPPAQPVFSDPPTDEEIFRAGIFSDPIVALPQSTSPRENADLARALLDFRNRPSPEDASSIEGFLAQYPSSPRKASLLLNVANVYRKTGQLSEAFSAWQEAWQIAKGQPDTAAKRLGDQAVSELALFLVSLGRTETLRDLLNEVAERPISGSAAEKISRAREALWQMENRPETSFKCGPFSLYRIRANLNLPQATHPLILEEKSTTNGTSLAQMWDLARRMDMDYQMARRQPGAPVLTPCMIHWKLGHFSAIVREENGRYLVEDTTFADPIWLTAQTIDDEAMGSFLVPGGPLPQGWEPIGPEEGQLIWGRMTPTTRDPNALTSNDPRIPDCPPSKGMAAYSVHAMQVSLNLRDIPVGYRPPLGPAVEFLLTYNHRESAQPATFNYSNLGQKWTFDWLAYVEDNPSNPNDNAKVYLRGGGGDPYSGFDTNTQSYALQQKSQTRLVRTSTNSYQRVFLDGSKEIYDVSNGSTNYPRKIFLRAIQDAVGNGITNTFDANFRLVSVTDAIGQVTTLTYGSSVVTNDLYYKVTQVTDPFGRYAAFGYNSSGQLTNITDTINISSSFTYGNGDFITSLTTPYGKTTFTNYESGLDRWVEITDPMGQKERIEYRDAAPDIPSWEAASLVPTGLSPSNGNNNLNQRNTFYWDKKAMQLYSGDYTKARLTHWLYANNSFYVIDGIPESTKSPLESRVWFNYGGQTDARQAGTTDQPNRIARVLDDGATQTSSLPTTPMAS